MAEFLTHHGVHALNWLQQWALLSLAGLLLARLWLWPAALRQDPVIGRHWFRHWWLMALVLLVCTAVILVLEVAALTGVGPLQALAQIGPVLRQSYAGQQWLARIVGLLLFLLLGWPWRRALLTPARALLALLALVLVMFTLSATSHAANQGNFTPLQLLHWLHLSALMGWAGAILVFHEHIRPCLRADRMSRAQVVAVIWRLSHLCAVAAVLVLLSGGLLSLTLLGGRWPEPGDNYGQLWLLKVGLVLVLVVIAARNRWLLLPALVRAQGAADSAQDSPDDAAAFGLALRRLQTALAWDWWVVLLVLLVAADLAHQVPPLELVGH